MINEGTSANISPFLAEQTVLLLLQLGQNLRLMKRK
jgi:hypothetical protein